MTTYRYSSRGELRAVLNRRSAAVLRSPLSWISLVGVGLVLGIVASLATYAASLPDYLGRVLLIGVFWGLIWCAAVALLLGALVVPLKALNRRLVTRLFPIGSVTEVELGEDSLVITRPTRTRTVPYRRIFRVRASGAFLRVEIKGRLMAELLPLGMLPDDAVQLIRTRARDLWPVTTVGEGSPDRQVVIPADWAAQVADAHTRAWRRTTGFWIRLGVVLLVAVLLAGLAHPAWLLVAPAWAITSVAGTYTRTRRTVAAAVPAGSVASAEFLEDRFITRNAAGAREIRFDEIRTADVRGDVVLLRLAGRRPVLAIPRALLPDDALQHLPR